MRIPPGFVRAANNVDIDSEDMIHMRQGVLQELLSGNCHSLWSDEGSLCFFVKDNNLIQINRVYKEGALWMVDYTTILTDVGPTKMNFVPVGHKTFFSNLSKVGYIEDGVAHAFPEVDKTKLENFNKKRMVGGSLIEYFNSRLYAAGDETIYHSDAGYPMVMDTRKNFFTLGGGLSMMLAVIDGLYVSHGNKVAFMHYQGEEKLGDFDLAIPKFKYQLLLDVPAIKGSAVAIERMDLGRDPVQKGLVGRCIIFSTNIGIFMGLPGGYVKDLTSDHYAVYDIEQGASLVKWHNGYRQYIFVGQYPAEISGVSGSSRLPSLIGDGS
jgi:hypothetical protein